MEDEQMIANIAKKYMIASRGDFGYKHEWVAYREAKEAFPALSLDAFDRAWLKGREEGVVELEETKKERPAGDEIAFSRGKEWAEHWVRWAKAVFGTDLDDYGFDYNHDKLFVVHIATRNGDFFQYDFYNPPFSIVLVEGEHDEH